VVKSFVFLFLLELKVSVVLGGRARITPFDLPPDPALGESSPPVWWLSMRTTEPEKKKIYLTLL